jgi:hypothetical protein
MLVVAGSWTSLSDQETTAMTMLCVGSIFDPGVVCCHLSGLFLGALAQIQHSVVLWMVSLCNQSQAPFLLNTMFNTPI